MIKNYVPSERKEEMTYEIVFYYEPGGGFGFPSDEHGKVQIDQMQPAAVENYQYAIAHPEKYPVAFNKLETRKISWREPARGVCHCGQQIELTDQYLGACECPHCGRWWNVFGQELKPVESWNDYGEMDYEY